MWNLGNGTDESVCRAVTELQTERTDVCTHMGKERVGKIGRVALTYVHGLCKHSGKLLLQKQLSLVLCGDLVGGVVRGGRKDPEAGDICTLRAGSHCCTAETNTTL